MRLRGCESARALTRAASFRVSFLNGASSSAKDGVQPQQLTVLDAQPDVFTFCTWGNVNIHVWWAPLVEPMVERLGAFSSATILRSRAEPRASTRPRRAGMSFVHIVTEDVGVPDPETRSALLALGKRFENDVGPTAVVVGGEGFWASALRGAITGLWLAVPKSMPMRMCGSIEEVAGWLPAKHLESNGSPIDADELIQVLQEASRRERSHTVCTRSEPAVSLLPPPVRNSLPPAPVRNSLPPAPLRNSLPPPTSNSLRPAVRSSRPPAARKPTDD